MAMKKNVRFVKETKQVLFNISNNFFRFNCNNGKVLGLVSAGQFNKLPDIVKQMKSKTTCAAKNVLMFYATALSGKYQYPIAMLFLNKTTSAIQTAVVKVIHKEFLKRNANIRVITTDGLSSNLAMFKELSCDLDPGKNEFIATGLNQPGSPNVRCMLDPLTLSLFTL